MVIELLRDNNSQQFHLVRLDAPQSDSDPTSTQSTPTLHLESTMSLGGLITFKWQFELHSYGGALEQCAFLRAQMYLPLHEMIKLLSWESSRLRYQLQSERRRFEQLQASISGSGSGSGSGVIGSAPHAAAAAGHHAHDSLSLSLPSLATAERDAQAQRLAGAVKGEPIPAPADSFDAFASVFTFGQVGSLYVSALNRLSGEDPASLIGSQPDESTIPPPSIAIESEAEEERSTTKRMTAAERRRGVKRDRSPPAAPKPAFVASSAAAAAYASPAADRSVDHRDSEIDYKHSDDLPLPSFPPPSTDFPVPSLLVGSNSLQSSLDIGGAIDADGVYRESELEKMRREALARQLSAQKKKKVTKQRHSTSREEK